MHFGQYEICNAMISCKLTRQALKRNDLTGQADAHRNTRTGEGRQKAGKIFTAELAETAEKDQKNSRLAAPENCKRQKAGKITLHFIKIFTAPVKFAALHIFDIFNGAGPG
jgi:hypothetical protein